MKSISNPRIAWLFPSLYSGNYWQPILSEFKARFNQVIVYTGFWPGFSPGYEDAFPVEVVGSTKFVATSQASTGYKRSYILPSWKIVGRLLRFRPHVIFTSAFSIWTALAIVLKPLCRWKVVIVFDGISTGTDYLNSGIRVPFRRVISWFADGFITNNTISKDYLTKIAGAKSDRIFIGPYLIPDSKILLSHSQTIDSNLIKQKPIFLYVGQIIPRKGLQFLLEACHLLKKRGHFTFALWIVGNGSHQEELETFAEQYELQDVVKWVGKVDYHCLGIYFQQADVFICPTLEDIWGMVVLEAMVLGKPVLCSKLAGSVDLIKNGENGYVFDPYQPEKLAGLMSQFIKEPNLIEQMGERSQQIMMVHTPKSVTKFLAEVVEDVLKR